MGHNRIRSIREDRGLTQEGLAALCHTSKAQVSKLEKGQRQLTQEWLYRLATALGCHWVELIEDTPIPRDRDEADLLGGYRGLSSEQQEFVRRIFRAQGIEPQGMEPQGIEPQENEPADPPEDGDDKGRKAING